MDYIEVIFWSTLGYFFGWAASSYSKSYIIKNKEYRCECFGWVENFENNGQLKEYLFSYCPYCGKELKTKEKI